MARTPRVAAVAATVAVALAVAGLARPGAPAADAAQTPAAWPTPVLAYYYIWFNASSWNRAKIDYPLLGRYSSDERSVMERQVRWAREAGLSGFIVSWKSTPVLNRRLHLLLDVAARQHFRVAIIYQGLDFHRRPRPTGDIRADLRFLAREFGHRRPLLFDGKPLVILSGTWEYGAAQVAAMTAPVRRRLTVLASERHAGSYARLASSVDGNAYYWSSGDPLTTPGYERKLRQMAAAVHRRGGLWVAPAAPGFDARLIGGRMTVGRRNGATLRASLQAAEGADPDLIGLISWNEYSENSHIEPSRMYGTRSLQTLADVLGAQPPSAGDLDSSVSAPTGTRHGLPLLAGFTVVLLGGAALLARRRRASHRSRTTHPPDPTSTTDRRSI
jgi:hypothetical protein